MNKRKYIHFIGIGGYGMSAIANVLLHHNYEVSGSDLNSNSMTKRLASRGAKIYVGHREENIKNVQAIVISSAISSEARTSLDFSTSSSRPKLPV
jgi:UDP-N-acetylmuramate--alanine ligase